MANARGMHIDNTHLSIDQAERRGFIHRDYIAHCLRWSHVAKHINKGNLYKTANILDIGCGVDLPLAKLLYSSRLIVKNYVGVDYNNTEKFDLSPFHTGKMKVNVYGGMDAAIDITPAPAGGYSVMEDIYEAPDVVTCFEVLEHVEPEHSVRILRTIYSLLNETLADGRTGYAFISTPCYDAQTGAAANHVNEITYKVLGAVLEAIGFKITGMWGTFASQKDYRDVFIRDYNAQALWDKLNEYYDSNYMATVFAPLYPERARNCLWQIRPYLPNETKTILFENLGSVPLPWSSSKLEEGFMSAYQDLSAWEHLVRG
jgi:SAM-dependent methyltransferase